MTVAGDAVRGVERHLVATENVLRVGDAVTFDQLERRVPVVVTVADVPLVGIRLRARKRPRPSSVRLRLRVRG